MSFSKFPSIKSGKTCVMFSFPSSVLVTWWPCPSWVPNLFTKASVSSLTTTCADGTNIRNHVVDISHRIIKSVDRHKIFRRYSFRRRDRYASIQKHRPPSTGSHTGTPRPTFQFSRRWSRADSPACAPCCRLGPDCICDYLSSRCWLSIRQGCEEASSRGEEEGWHKWTKHHLGMYYERRLFFPLKNGRGCKVCSCR